MPLSPTGLGSGIDKDRPESPHSPRICERCDGQKKKRRDFQPTGGLLRTTGGNRPTPGGVGEPGPGSSFPPAARVEIAMINRNLTIAASILFAVHSACGPAKAASESERLAAQLEQIYQATKDSQDREIVAAASVISTLVGALQSHRTLELSDFVLPFSQSEVDRLQEEIKRRRGL